MSIDLKNNSIILYGAGYAGLHFCELLIKGGIHPLYFLDKDKNKKGKYWIGIEVKLFDQNISLPPDALVIVCLLSTGSIYDKIVQSLQAIGVKNIIHMQEIQVDSNYGWLFKKQNLLLSVDKNKFYEYEKEFYNIQRYLEPKSKNLYISILNYILNDFKGMIYSRPINEQYWAYDIFSKNKNEIVLDCGAFDGTVMQYFLQQNSAFNHYYAIEPDFENVKRIKKKACDSITIIQNAVSDKNEVLKMRNYMNMNSVVVSDGDFEVAALTLDEICQNPTFIKIDVEGFEEKALLGANHILKKSRPIIACAMYHSLEQFWKIPKIIINSTYNYKYFIRSYMNVHETVFYAVPLERML